jgi:streptomycin 6-kinase
LPDGTPAALKLAYPHRERKREPDALERWGGDGSVRVLARDDVRGALLLERYDPGTPLSGSAEALDIGELASTQGEQVLVHRDLHGENVLPATREPWLVIDPKPLAGEREFAVAPIVRSFELGHGKRLETVQWLLEES